MAKGVVLAVLPKDLKDISRLDWFILNTARCGLEFENVDPTKLSRVLEARGQSVTQVVFADASELKLIEKTAKWSLESGILFDVVVVADSKECSELSTITTPPGLFGIRPV